MVSTNQNFERLFSPSFFGNSPGIVKQFFQIDSSLGKCDQLMSPSLSLLNQPNFLMSPPSFSKPKNKTNIKPFVDVKDADQDLTSTSVTDHNFNSIRKNPPKLIQESHNNSLCTKKAPKSAFSVKKPTIILQNSNASLQCPEKENRSKATQTDKSEPIDEPIQLPYFMKTQVETLDKTFLKLDKSVKESERAVAAKKLKKKRLQVSIQSILDFEVKSDQENDLTEQECLDVLEASIYPNKKREILVRRGRPVIKLASWREILGLLSLPCIPHIECTSCHAKFETKKQLGGHKSRSQSCKTSQFDKKSVFTGTGFAQRKLVKKS